MDKPGIAIDIVNVDGKADKLGTGTDTADKNRRMDNPSTSIDSRRR